MKPTIALLALSVCALAQTAQYPGAVATDQQLKVGVNNATTSLSSPMLSTDNVLVVSNSTGFVSNMLVTVGSEIISICSVNGNILNVGLTSGSCPNVAGRGFDGTTATAHNASTAVNGFIDAWHHNSLRVEIEAIETALGANLTNVGAWNKLTNPSGNLSLSLGANTSTWTAGTATGSGVDVFKLQDTASNTGTGNLLRLSTAASSALHPYQFDANGNGTQMNTSGIVFPVGSGGIDASSLVSGSVPASRIASSTITNAMLAGSIAAAKLIGTDIATVGTVTAGTWNATAVAPIYGGTGIATYVKGDLLCASNATTLTRLSVGSDTNVLTADSTQTCGVKWAAAGSGSVSITATSPVVATPSPITGTGVLSCPTCTTSAAALTNNQLLIGQAGQATAALGSLGTTTTVLHGNASGAPTFGFVNLATDIAGTIPFANAYPSGTQTQFLRIQPNTGNATTVQWASPNRAVITDYNFAAQTPGGSLTSGTTPTITLTPCPLGVAGTDTGHALRISGGTGSAEQVLITGGTCTSGAASGTVVVGGLAGGGIANNHSGAWTIASATGGTQEAFNVTPDIWAPAGTYLIYAPVTVPSNGHLFGTGMFTSTFQAQSASTGIFDATGTRNTFEDVGCTATSQGTAGSYCIRLGNGTGNENSFTRINRVYCEPLYDCVLGVNGSQPSITNSVFYNFSHSGVTAQDTTNPDFDGPLMSNNVFFVFSLSSPATAAVIINSTSSIQEHGDVIIGGGANQLNYCLDWTSTTSGGWWDVNVKCEKPLLEGITMTGALGNVHISGMIGNTGAQANWNGIHLNGTGTSPAVQFVDLSGLVIECQSTGNNGVYLQGTYRRLSLQGGIIDSCNFGVNANTNPTEGSVTIGPVAITNWGTSPVFSAGTNVLVQNAGTINEAELTSTLTGIGAVGNGSTMFCTDCKNVQDNAVIFDSNVVSAGNGTNALMENGHWRVH